MNTFVDQVAALLVNMPERLQRQVLQFTRALAAQRGVPGRQLVRFAGSIAPDDLQTIAQAIEQDCERVDTHEW